MGVRLGKDGLKPDKVKVKAILEMPDPTDRAGVLRLMGMLNFLSPFIPNKSSITAPLRNLLKSDVAWHWEYEQKEAMRKVKEILSSDTTLKLFEVDKPITIQADASSTGLEACLMQNDQPVAYASRSLTDCETKYAQLEKELLAIVFAVEKFHQYIYGSEVTVQSDHKPLENIFKKSIYKSTSRIQLMRMRLMRYNLSVGYKKGSQMYIADTLSRAYLSDTHKGTEAIEESEYRIHQVTEYMPAGEERLNMLREQTEKDEDLQKLRKLVYQGWPEHRS